MNEAFFSLKDLIEMKEYAPTRIFSLAPNPEQIEVRHVTSIERATKGFIRRGEYVLTTAVYWTTEEKFLQFVKEIYLGGAVAIAFSFMENVDGVPESVKEFARERQFTLIQLPWQYRFADIIADVLKRIERQQRQIIESWNELQNELLTAYLHHSTLHAAVRIIAKHLHEVVLLTDPQRRPLALSAGSPGAEPLSPEKLADFHYFSALTQKNLVLGHLYLGKQQLTAQQIETLKPFSSSILVPILLWFDREDIIQSTRTSLIDDLIWELAGGGFGYREEDFTRARMLGLHLNHLYKCVVGYVCIGKEDVSDVWLDENADKLKQHLIQARWSALMTVQNHYIIAFIGGDEDPYAYMRSFLAAAAAFDPSLGCAWGVSNDNAGKTFEAIYREAKLCANVCRVEQGPGHAYSPADTAIYRMLLPALKSAEASRNAEEFLAPLLETGEDKRTEMLHILNCYFKNNFNVCETARELYYNRQTLRYKLKKAEDLLGISFQKHEQALYTELCMRLCGFRSNDAFNRL